MPGGCLVILEPYIFIHIMFEITHVSALYLFFSHNPCLHVVYQNKHLQHKPMLSPLLVHKSILQPWERSLHCKISHSDVCLANVACLFLCRSSILY
jgi:hypothetical protein